MGYHDPTAALVARLEARGFGPRSTGPKSWESRCPAHAGSRLNLSIRRGDDARALVHCHHVPSCAAREIVAALGMTEADLFPPRDDPTPSLQTNGRGRTMSRSGGLKIHPTPEAAIGAMIREYGKPTAHWAFLIADGTEALRVYRFDFSDPETGEPDKTYRPVHPTPEGWVMGDPPGPLPLYRLPDLTPGRVYVTEGEKCADLAAARLGVTVTTSAHGAQSAAKSDWSPLAGREVVILPDHNPEGESYARSVTVELAKLTPRPTVRIVRLADLWGTDAPIPLKGDIEQWLTEGVPDVWCPEECRAELDRVADQAPAVDLDAPTPAEPGSVIESEPPIRVPSWPDPPEASAFDGLAGDIVCAIEPHTEADPVAILAQLLIGFGNLIGRSAHFAVEADRHYGNEFTALVGDTAKGRKGTSWGHARRLLEAIDTAWAADRIMTGLASGAGLKYAVRDQVVKREPIRDAKSKRTVGYQDIETDPGEPDKRLLVIEPELGGVLRVAARDGNDLSAVVRQSWDSGDLRNMTRSDPLRASGAHISIIGHITRQELSILLTRTEAANGFANRFLWLAVRRSKLLPFGGHIEAVDFGPMLRQLRESADLGRSRGRMDRDADADRLWADAYPKLSEGRPGLLGAVTSRAEAHTMRLAMLYALLDRSPAIRAGHLRSALALWRYSERSASYIFGDALGDPDADALLDALRAAPDGLTRTEIRDVVFQRHRTADQITGMLRTLAAPGLAHFRREKTGGRDAERWFADRAPARYAP